MEGGAVPPPTVGAAARTVGQTWQRDAGADGASSLPASQSLCCVCGSQRSLVEAWVKSDSLNASMHRIANERRRCAPSTRILPGNSLCNTAPPPQLPSYVRNQRGSFQLKYSPREERKWARRNRQTRRDTAQAKTTISHSREGRGVARDPGHPRAEIRRCKGLPRGVVAAAAGGVGGEWAWALPPFWPGARSPPPTPPPQSALIQAGDGQGARPTLPAHHPPPRRVARRPHPRGHANPRLPASPLSP